MVDGWCVIIIEFVEVLNMVLVNVLLKMFEELGDCVFIILLVDYYLKLFVIICSCL